MVSTQFPLQMTSSLATKSTEPRALSSQAGAKTLPEFTEKNITDSVKKPGFTPLTAEQAAGNILGFIAKQLDRDKAAGASAEELEARLQAGLKGFKQGFNEAKEKLEALSMLTPPVQASINKTFDLVMEGIDDLALQHLGKLLASPEVQVSGAGTDTRPEASRASLYGEYLAIRSDTFSFELTTAEGDKVVINAARQDASSASVQAGNGNLSLQASAFSASQFSLTVEGNLNDDERAAIDQLLVQVDALAADFYRGDVEAAFESALELGYDTQQISAFALNLTRVDVQRASSAYSDGTSGQDGGLQQQLEPLGHFVKDILAALDTADAFDEPRALLGSLAEKVVQPEPGEEAKPRTSFAEFVEALLAKADKFNGLSAAEVKGAAE
ncbi:MAG TPA: DUF5610 domain-containing protein [Cellvibrionaceae bacterium]